MKFLSNKLRIGAVIFSTAVLLYSTGCATSRESHNPNSSEIYTPVPKESKEKYKPGPGTSCLVNALTFMFHLGGL